MKRISLFFVLIMLVLQLVAQSNRYAESSVLSTGDWYKIQVEQSGIHKITYEQLVEMGLKNPANVSVFGYGGAQLPEAFTKPYIDDLPQLSIYMEKGSDNVFGKGDYILFYAQGPIKWEYNTKQKIFELTDITIPSTVTTIRREAAAITSIQIVSSTPKSTEHTLVSPL